MEDIKVRKMQLGDHIGLHKNIFLTMPLEAIEKNVISNVMQMKEENSSWSYFVAEIDGEIVGTMYLECKTRSFDNHIGELYSVVTAENYRERGICKKLFETICLYALEKKLKKIILSVRAGAIAETVYQKLGFIRYGELPNGIKDEDKYVNKVYYYYDLK